jgi:hypothetical protein
MTKQAIDPQPTPTLSDKRSIYVCERCDEVHDADTLDSGEHYTARGDCPSCRIEKVNG